MRTLGPHVVRRELQLVGEVPRPRSEWGSAVGPQATLTLCRGESRLRETALSIVGGIELSDQARSNGALITCWHGSEELVTATG